MAPKHYGIFFSIDFMLKTVRALLAGARPKRPEKKGRKKSALKLTAERGPNQGGRLGRAGPTRAAIAELKSWLEVADLSFGPKADFAPHKTKEKLRRRRDRGRGRRTSDSIDLRRRGTHFQQDSEEASERPRIGLGIEGERAHQGVGPQGSVGQPRKKVQAHTTFFSFFEILSITLCIVGVGVRDVFFLSHFCRGTEFEFE